MSSSPDIPCCAHWQLLSPNFLRRTHRKEAEAKPKFAFGTEYLPQCHLGPYVLKGYRMGPSILNALLTPFMRTCVFPSPFQVRTTLVSSTWCMCLRDLLEDNSPVPLPVQVGEGTMHRRTLAGLSMANCTQGRGRHRIKGGFRLACVSQFFVYQIALCVRCTECSQNPSLSSYSLLLPPWRRCHPAPSPAEATVTACRPLPQLSMLVSRI